MQETTLQLIAGYKPDGQAVLETLRVKKINEQHWYELQQSPAFVKDIAGGDIITIDPKRPGLFSLQTRSGNLSVRVMSRGDISTIRDALTADLEKLGGQLDIESDRILVYTIHVSCGFTAIEESLNKHVSSIANSAWFYGNVYDPHDGETPLNWWNEILQPQ
jgi:hypothetical protein